MLPLIENFRYRPEIDGLRALAVAAVVLFHAGLGVPGGYVGVDVFFVISGYLITSLIVRDLQRGTFSMREFWQRRVRRILPALLVVVVTTLLAGWFLLLPDDYAELGESAAFQAFFAANVYFWRDTGYFAGAAEVKPLLHTWSLAVEEQFYLIVPFLLVGLFRFSIFRKRSVLLASIGAAILISLAGSIYGTAHRPSATFFLLPMRAWELLVGSFLALMPAAWLPKQRLVRELTSAVGMAGILIPCFLYTSETIFPGLAAVPIVTGTFLIILASGTLPRDPSVKPTIIGRLLSVRPIVFVGLISYSLYLWHWPLLAFLRYQILFPDGVELRVLLVAAALGLAVVSYYAVETPLRTRRLFTNDQRLLPTAAASLAMVILAAGWIKQSAGFPSRLSPQIQQLAATVSERPVRYSLNVADVPENLVRLGAEEGEPRILVWGDSHARAILPAIDAICRDAGIAARAATHSSTAPVLGYFRQTRYGLNEQAIPFGEAIVNYIRSAKLDGVLLAGYWEGYLTAPNSEAFRAALLRTVETIQSSGTRVYFMRQVPEYDFDIARALAVYALTQRTCPDAQLVSACGRRSALQEADLVQALKDRQVTVLEPLPALQRLAAGLPFDAGGAFYRDSHHLSTHGALAIRQLFAPLVLAAHE